MGLESEYKKHAANSLDLATRQANVVDKNRLLAMAEAWLDLADRIAGRSETRATVDHPLVEQALRLNRADAE